MSPMSPESETKRNFRLSIFADAGRPWRPLPCHFSGLTAEHCNSLFKFYRNVLQAEATLPWRTGHLTQRAEGREGCTSAKFPGSPEPGLAGNFDAGLSFRSGYTEFVPGLASIRMAP